MAQGIKGFLLGVLQRLDVFGLLGVSSWGLVAGWNFLGIWE